MMSWFSECILQLCQPEQWCLLHMSGRGLVVIWGSLQLVRPRAGTEHNFSLQRWITFLPLGSPLPHSVFFSLSQLLRCLSLIFLSFLPYSPPLPLSIVISCTPPPPRTHHPPPYLFLDLCSSLSAGLFCLSPFVLDTPRGGTRRVQLVRSFRLVLLSLLWIREGPVYQ